MGNTVAYALGIVVVVLGAILAFVADVFLGGVIALAGAVLAYISAQRSDRDISGD